MVAVTATMRAFRVARPRPAAEGPLERVEVPVPDPAPDEVLLRVLACGVCRTDLHVAEGDLPVHRRGVVPGHEVVGEVEAAGAEVTGLAAGDRVGVAWLRRTCGRCRYCRRGAENLCPDSAYTGWDADGGYADHVVAPAAFVHRLPGGYSDVELAPLLCAGIIGFRALRRAELPEGGRLGVYGFGGSAHLATQVALAQGATVHVMTRSPAARELASSLGAASVQGAADRPPEPLDAAILFAPVGTWCSRPWRRSTAAARWPSPASTSPTCRPWTTSATCSRSAPCAASPRTPGPTRASSSPSRPATASRSRTVPYALEDAGRALADLAADRVTGAAVLLP